MESSVRLYSFNFDEARTYMWAALFVACNMLLQVLGAWLILSVKTK